VNEASKFRQRFASAAACALDGSTRCDAAFSTSAISAVQSRCPCSTTATGLMVGRIAGGQRALRLVDNGKRRFDTAFLPGDHFALQA
jgi:hypothetical protein